MTESTDRGIVEREAIEVCSRGVMSREELAKELRLGSGKLFIPLLMLYGIIL